eukprot:jgi/Botrbrau1/15167/Bobra.0149s0032.1
MGINIEDKGVRSLLTGAKVVDLVPAHQSVVCFEHDDTIGSVLERLAYHKLLSGPVLIRQDHQAPGSLEQAPAGTIPVKSILGFVDLGVILKALMAEVEKSNGRAQTPDGIEEVARKLCGEPIQSLLEGAPSQRALIGSDACSDWALKGALDMSLLDAIREGFVQEVKVGKEPYVAVHRLALFNSHEGPEGGEIHLWGIISQSDVIRYVFNHIEQIGEVGKEPITDKLPSSVPTTVSGSEQTLKAFKQMWEKGLSALAVVDESGHLTGNLSASDLRCLAPGLFAAPACCRWMST